MSSPLPALLQQAIRHCPCCGALLETSLQWTMGLCKDPACESQGPRRRDSSSSLKQAIQMRLPNDYMLRSASGIWQKTHAHCRTQLHSHAPAQDSMAESALLEAAQVHGLTM